MCWVPKVPFGPFCSLPSTCLVLPGAATCWLALKPCSAQKRRSKKALFTLCTGPCSCAFSFQCEKGPVLAAAPSKLFCVLHIHPPCAAWALNPVLGTRESQPQQFLSGYHRQGMDYPGLGMDYGEGEVGGSPCLCQSCRAHAVKMLCARRESPVGLSGMQCGKRERPALRHTTQLRQCVTAFKLKKRKKKHQACNRTSRQSSLYGSSGNCTHPGWA